MKNILTALENSFGNEIQASSNGFTVTKQGSYYIVDGKEIKNKIIPLGSVVSTDYIILDHLRIDKFKKDYPSCIHLTGKISIDGNIHNIHLFYNEDGQYVAVKDDSSKLTKKYKSFLTEEALVSKALKSVLMLDPQKNLSVKDKKVERFNPYSRSSAATGKSEKKQTGNSSEVSQLGFYATEKKQKQAHLESTAEKGKAAWQSFLNKKKK